MIEELKKHFVYLNKDYIEGEVYKIIENINLSKKVKEAKIYLTGFGMYDVLINSCKIGDQLFKPGYTYYPHRLLYQEYDITSLLKEDNLLEIFVGQGWYCGRFFCENTVQNYGKLPSISYVLKVIFEDGTEQLFTSFEGQKAYDSEYVYAGEYDGEVVDFSKQTINKQIGILNGFSFPDNVSLEKTTNEVKIQEEMKIIKIFNHDDYTILDFGQNFAGIISIDPKYLKDGEKIVVRHGEILNSDGSLYVTNLRKAKATISYTKNLNNYLYTPRFTYMGFRYVEIKGVKYVDGLIKANAIYTNMERTGNFNCSHPKVNKLYNNLVWGQRSNYVEVPTDCPQRDERFGYTGDGHVFALTGSYNFNTLKFWKNYFIDLNLGQSDNPDGNVAPYIPQLRSSPVGFMSMQGWGSAVSIIPEIIYEQYGDLEFFLSQYTAIKKYVDLEINKAGKKYLWKAISLGDWLSLRKGMAWQALNNYPVSNSFFVNDLRILLKILKLKGFNEEYDYYSSIYEKVKQSYLKAFIYKNGKVKKDYQGTYVLALKHVLDKEKPLTLLVRNKFLQNVKKYGLDTGFFGTEHLLPMIIEAGDTKLAFDILLNEKCPGWMYQINKGATTTWERWDALREDGTVNESKSGKDNMVSFNHYSFGSVGEFYYQYILGIKPLEPGYKKVIIRPYSDARLEEVNGSYKSVNGNISSSWKRSDNHIEYDFNIEMPGIIILENGEKHDVGPGRYHYEIDIK